MAIAKLYMHTGEDKGEVNLPEGVFGVEPNRHVMWEAVRNYLAKAQISPAMMTIRGFGESRPIASNRTAKGRQKNRRVEIVIEGLTR